MAYDQKLAVRVDAALGEIDPPKLVDKRMFGGIGFMVQGNMACGVIEDKLIVRVGAEAYEDSFSKPGVVPFDITGRPMKGWVMVASSALEEEEVLLEWVQQGVDFALSLPPK